MSEDCIGGTILPPIPPRSRRRVIARRWWAVVVAGVTALFLLATGIEVYR